MQFRGIQNTKCFEPESVGISEIDIDAIVSYAAIHCGLTEEMIDKYDAYPTSAEMRQYLTDLNIGYVPEKDKQYNWMKSGKAFERKVKKVWLACMLSKNYGDVSRIERMPKADLWFLSFPCQSISNAGKMDGIAEGSGTRSSLVWETIRLLRVAKETDMLPSYMMLENVKALINKHFLKDFDRFNKLIEDEFGFTVQWKVLNGLECGVPQNRERVFAIYIRKDIDTGKFEFPQPFDNGIRINDILADEVGDEYYLNRESVQKMIDALIIDERLNEYLNE